jgi:transposase-like protein
MPMRRDKNARREELLDQLLETLDDPSELTGTDGLMRQLMGRMVEKSLNAELTEHLGYEPNEPRPGTNARNGTTPKTLLTESGKVEVDIPRDRDGTFEPKLVKKRQRRLEGFNERILQLYGRGMTAREIQDFFLEAYGAEISPTLRSGGTGASTSCTRSSTSTAWW